MSKSIIVKAVAGAALIAAPATAGFAQAWMPGSEIAGHSVQVEANGVMNTVHFEPGGVARIQTPAGNVVPATWGVTGNQLCLSAANSRECWTYNQPFQAGQQVTLTSSCGASQWMALSTAQPPMPMGQGERG